MKKTAIITGASGGIGSEVARHLSAMGYNLALIYNNSKENALKLVSEISETGSLAVAIKCDIKDNIQVKNAVIEATKQLGHISLIVNNAGVSYEGLLTDMTESEWDNVFDVNIKSIFNFCHAILPEMIKQHSGKIINISSMWGQVGASCEVAYSASKSAVIGFTKALAKEVSPSGIFVNCICPGVIKTKMLDCYTEDDLNALKEDTPIGRLGSPCDIANMVDFLASDKSEFITGQIFGVNGGFII